MQNNRYPSGNRNKINLHISINIKKNIIQTELYENLKTTVIFIKQYNNVFFINSGNQNFWRQKYDVKKYSHIKFQNIIEGGTPILFGYLNYTESCRFANGQKVRSTELVIYL